MCPRPVLQDVRGDMIVRQRSQRPIDMTYTPDTSGTLGTLGAPSTPKAEGHHDIALPSRRAQLTWKQGIFTHCIPKRFKKCSCIWTLLRGAIIWFLWKERNEVAFLNQSANPQKVCAQVWLSLNDYGKTTWANTLKKAKSTRG